MKSNNTSEATKWPQESAILECLSCYSHRAIVLNTEPPRARCADCSKTYSIHYEKPLGSLALTDNEENREELPKTRQRKTKADYRAEITPAPPLSAQ
jgi:transposase-like protein